MATNKILKFAELDTTSNLLTDAEYSADAQRIVGNQPGVARSKLVNKALRQSSTVASAVAQFVSENQAADISDSDTPASLSNKFSEALQSGMKFLQSGTGAVVTTVQSKLREAVSVKDFGAIGDGIADDSGPWLNAQANVETNGGGIVDFPAGNYKILHALGPASDGSTHVIRRGGLHYVDDGFAPNLRQQSRSSFRADTYVENGTGAAGFLGLSFNGTPITSTLQNFSAVATPDTCVFSGWGVRGSQGVAGTNPLIPGNIGAWFENNSHLVWALEVDCNNEGGNGPEGSDNHGVGICLNTGSTYSPDTALSIRRQSGAGTGPGWKRGIEIKGARNVGLRIEAMAPATYPGMVPAAPGTLEAIQINVSGDSFIRAAISESGRIEWGSGTTDRDVAMYRSGPGVLTVAGRIEDTAPWVVTNPTPTSASGTFGNASASLRTKNCGKTIHFSVTVTITTNGTAAGSVIVPLPFASSAVFTASGRENGVSGKMLQALVQSSSLYIYNYDNTYPGGNGASLIVTGVYERA